MKKPLLFALILLCATSLFSQKPKRYTSSEILLKLEKLNVLGSALYIAAHPDDENTRLIGYLSQGKKVETAYLSLTRGDGGQNLVGPEIREQLGVIRTQELIQARSVDGSQQFFSRANDFGYSKNPEETFTIWDREQVLHDAVWVIRKFRPDVMITRFPADGRGGHGHHTASAMIAKEAMEAAADPNRFPEQLKYVETWQPKRLYWNTHWWFYGGRDQVPAGETIQIPVGDYNHLLGESYTEIAATSRSMHKSQGFGSTGTRGEEVDHLLYVAGDSATNGDLFQDINTSWSRIEKGEQIGKMIDKVLADFDPVDPSRSVPALIEIYQQMEKHSDDYWIDLKKKELEKIILASMGVYVEAVASDYAVALDDTLAVSIELINRSDISTFYSVSDDYKALAQNTKVIEQENRYISADNALSQPYWLREEGSLGMFTVSDPADIGKPENTSAVRIPVGLKIEGVEMKLEVPVVYKRNDPVDGEVYRPLAIIPPVFVESSEPISVFPDNESRQISVTVKAGKNKISGNISVAVPNGWKAEPASIPYELADKWEEKTFSVRVTPTQAQSEGYLELSATAEGKAYSKSLITIEYDHIPTQTLFPDARMKLVKVDIKKAGNKVAYIMGAGDAVPEALRQIGYEVDMLEPGSFSAGSLSGYDAVITGVRAWNTVNRLKFDQDELFNYVKEGGNLIVQYNTNRRLVTDQLAPYELQLSRERVTDETAEVTILNPDHPIMNFPNRITKKDFEGWVQERGLYFPNQWGEEFEALLSCHDPGETAKEGGLLVAKYGKGHYIYTGYSWFRELPAAVPGAFRIFSNMISISQEQQY